MPTVSDERREVGPLFAPLDLEQALHFLDVLTWFPENTPDRWQNVARYVHERSPESEPHPVPVYESLMDRLLDHLGSGGTPAEQRNGRWALIPEPKRLYALKYDLKADLYADAWFSFMNMGYAELDTTEPQIDLPPSERIMSFSAQLYDRVARAVPLEGRDVLEVGCGRGGGAALVARRHAPRSYVGVDYSANNIAFCRRHHHVPTLRFQRGDAEALPFDDAQFDAVLNIESAHCYPSPERFLREVHRTLRPGGHLLLSDEWWTEDLDRLRSLLSGSGLELEHEEDLTPQIIHALSLLEDLFPAWLERIEDEAKRRVWRRFFSKRVCTDSAESYRSGRFGFYLFVLRKPS